MKLLVKLKDPKLGRQCLNIGIISFVIGLVLGAFAFMEAWNCSGVCSYDVISVLVYIGVFLAVGFILISVFLFGLASRSKKARTIIVLAYVLLALFTAYKLVGEQFLGEEAFVRTSGVTFYRATQIPAGYKEHFKEYSQQNTRIGSFSTGKYLTVTYRKPSRVSGKWSAFIITQGDETSALNNSILQYCRSSYKCDVTNGQHIRDINCQPDKAAVCSVKLGDTYITVRDDNHNVDLADINYENPEFTKEEAIAIIDSLVVR